MNGLSKSRKMCCVRFITRKPLDKVRELTRKENSGRDRAWLFPEALLAEYELFAWGLVL